MRSDTLKGILYALLSAAGYSSVYILARFAQTYTEIETFLFWWFLYAAILSFLVVRKKIGGFRESVKSHTFFFVYFGVSEAVGTFIFFYLLRIMNPSILAFVGNLSPVFVAVWAFIILREKLTLIEAAGGLIAISGVLIITGASPSGEILKILIVVAITMMFSFNSVLVRLKVRDIPPFFMVTFRIFSLLTVYTVYLLIQKGGIRLPDVRSIPFIIAGATMGPVVATFSVFQALRYLKAADVSIIKSIQPLLVTMGSFVFLGKAVTLRQLMGGILIILGVNLVVVASSRESK